MRNKIKAREEVGGLSHVVELKKKKKCRIGIKIKKKKKRFLKVKKKLYL